MKKIRNGIKVQKELQKFKIGDKVWWESQAQGTTARKYGQVIVVVNPWENPSLYFEGVERSHNATVAYGGGSPRDEESYLVLVRRYGVRGPGKAKIYWPKVKNLNPLE